MIFQHRYFVLTIRFGLFFLGLNLFFNMVRLFIFPDADIPFGWPVSILVLRMPSFIFPSYSEYTTLGTNIYFRINTSSNT